MTDPQRIVMARRQRLWLVMALIVSLVMASSSRAFVFGEPLPTLPPVVGEGPPAPGNEQPPDGSVDQLPVGGIVDDEPPTAPSDVQSTPEPTTIVSGLLGAGIATMIGWRRRSKK